MDKIAAKYLVLNFIIAAFLMGYSLSYRFRSPERDLFPIGASEVQDSSIEFGSEGSKSGDVLVHKIPDVLIAPQFSVFHGVMTFKNVLGMKPELENHALVRLSVTRPQWFASRLKLQFLLDLKEFQKMSCEIITLRLNESTDSINTNCVPEKITGSLVNVAAYFSFSKPILPGHYTAELRSQSFEFPKAGVRLKTKVVADGIAFAHALSANQITLVELISHMLGYSRSNAISYLFFLSILALYLYLSRNLAVSFKITGLALVLAGAISALTPYFSGNDELAQVDYFYTAYEQALQVTPEIKAAMRSRFNSSARNEVRFADFYQLHNVGVIPESQCPHIIVVGGCGSSPEGLRFYRKILPFLNGLKIKLGDDALAYLRLGRQVNMMFFLLLVFLALFLRETYRFGFFVFTLLSGSLFALLPTVSNDFAVHVFSLAALLFLLFLNNSKKLRVKMIWLLCAMVVSAASFWSDRVGILVVPQLFVTLFAIYIFENLKDKRRLFSINQNSLGDLTKYIVLVGSFCASLIIVVYGLPWSAGKLLELGLNFEELKTVADSSGLLDSRFLEYIFVNFKSFLGSYVWNHSYLNPVFYIACFCFIVTILVSAQLEKLRSQFYLAVALAIFGGSLLGLHLGLLNAILPDKSLPDTWTFAVWRIYAPHVLGFGYLTVTSFESIFSWAQSRNVNHLVSQSVFFFLYCCLVYLVFCGYPQIFLADRY